MVIWLETSSIHSEFTMNERDVVLKNFPKVLMGFIKDFIKQLWKLK